MNRTNSLQGNRVSASMLAVVGLLLAGGKGEAQSARHLTITQPGGMPGLPVVTGITRGTNGVRVTWDGPSGYYRLLQRVGLTDGVWEAVGGPSLEGGATVAAGREQAYFRVSGPSPEYAGAQVCMECHEGIHASEQGTRHTGALETLRRVGNHEDPSCLPCHTVGYGLPTGYVDEASTPHLAGVQCENCHGPAAAHAANAFDFTVRPRADLAAQVCGGCHSVAHFPTYQEWKTSAHVEVTEDMNPSNRISSCGRCHSGSARLSLIKGDVLPVGDANVGITCAVCHDPHANHVWTNPLSGVVTTNLLRNPVASLEDYSLSTGDDFATKYNPAINLCGQCHNHRGASWASSSRPPHHSPQYNMMLGTVGVLAAGVGGPSTHAVAVEKQCVGCHMPEETLPDGSHALPHHSFKVRSYDSCLPCHPLPGGLVDFTRQVIEMRIQEVKGLLDQWAMTKAPAEIRKYGVLAWEYDNAGELSEAAGTAGGPVSSSNAALDEQKHVPDAIKKARFNVYLVLHDGSFGVHNPDHSIRLLEAARDWVWGELSR